MKVITKVFQIGLISLFVIASGQLFASNSACNNRFLAADDTYYAGSNSDHIDIIYHAEPDLPPIVLDTEKKKKQKSSTSFFSWLTKSHTMPSLHFIEFIELFSHEEQ